MIDKRLLGKRLYVHLHPEKEEGEEFVKKGAVYLPTAESQKGIRQYRLCTVLQVGDEISEIFTEGDVLRLTANGRESKFNVDDKTFHLIPLQDVISIVK